LLGLGGQIDMSVAIALGAMSAIAVFAGVFMADVLQDYEVRWKVLQLLVFLLADALALLAAAGASLFRFIQVVFDGQAWQMVGKFLTTVLGTVGRFGSGSGRWRQKFNPGHQKAEEQQLPGIKAFGPWAIAASQQRRQAMTQQLIVLVQELDRFVALSNGLVALDDQALEEDRVVGKFQEGRIVHDSAASYAWSTGILQ
jgi:hypothetical protein